MKLNEFIAEMSKIFLAIPIWEESGGVEDKVYAYFRDDEDDGRLCFVFIALSGPIYVGKLMKAMSLEFVDDIGLTQTIAGDGTIIEGAYDLIVALNQEIEDLEVATGCNCENCGGCDCEDDDEKVWN